MTMKRKLLLIVMNLRSFDHENFYKTLIRSRKESRQWNTHLNFAWKNSDKISTNYQLSISSAWTPIAFPLTKKPTYLFFTFLSFTHYPKWRRIILNFQLLSQLMLS